MVFFVYIGGGPRALALSGAMFFLSMLLQRFNYDLSDGFFEDFEAYGPDWMERRRLERRRRSQHSFMPLGRTLGGSSGGKLA